MLFEQAKNWQGPLRKQAIQDIFMNLIQASLWLVFVCTAVWQELHDSDESKPQISQ